MRLQWLASVRHWLSVKPWTLRGNKWQRSQGSCSLRAVCWTYLQIEELVFVVFLLANGIMEQESCGMLSAWTYLSTPYVELYFISCTSLYERKPGRLKHWIVDHWLAHMGCIKPCSRQSSEWVFTCKSTTLKVQPSQVWSWGKGWTLKFYKGRPQHGSEVKFFDSIFGTLHCSVHRKWCSMSLHSCIKPFT